MELYTYIRGLKNMTEKLTNKTFNAATERYYIRKIHVCFK